MPITLSDLQRANAAPWLAVGAEAVRYLQRLVRFDTSNPPGNEQPAAEFLRDLLTSHGIEVWLGGPLENRTSLVARLRGDGSRAPLLLVSHLDVVPAPPAGWSVEPFGGIVKDDYLWGRGAMDCKYRVIAHAMVLLLLKRSRARLRRDIIMAACADEETGGQLGMEWLAQTHPEKIDAELVLGEGGGGEIPAPRGSYCAVGTAEKGAVDVEIVIHGRPGHSLRIIPDNAMSRLGDVLARLKEQRLATRMTESARLNILGIAAGQEPDVRVALLSLLEDSCREEGVSQLRRLAPVLMAWLEPSLHNTITPTQVVGGIGLHCYPPEISLKCNARFLPSFSADELIASVNRRLDGLEGVELRILQVGANASESPVGTGLFNTLVELMQELRPGVVVVPWLLGGETDVRFLRGPGRAVYGFFPSLLDPPPGPPGGHGIDERVSLFNIRWSIMVLHELSRRLCL
jgi:acetylornithine deacetylase/succinyl-diaminopimelate desuccinylase-like protein